MTKSRIKHFFKRNKLLYNLRFFLLSRTKKLYELENLYYNKINRIEDLPEIFFHYNKIIFENQNPKTDIEKALTIAIWMRKNLNRGRGLGLDSGKCLQIMTESKGGVCSDFAQVFNNFCLLNNIKVREWGLKCLISEKKLSGGHSFNEFYSQELKKWIAIDTYKSIWFVDSTTHSPLSTSEVFKNGNQNLTFEYIDKSFTTDEQRVKDVYISPFFKPFFIENYSNKTYDFFLKKLKFLPIPLIHGIIFISGKSYKFYFVE